MHTEPQQGPTVLVVEDDADIRALVRFRLVRAGFAVEEAADGAAGLEAARTLLPDVVLLDWMMPGMDGLEVCRRLREDPRTAGVAIVMLTARARGEDAERGLAAGADAYLAKPFAPGELTEAIEQARRARPG